MEINSRLDIPLTELSYSFSRSSGPGGQNVNKVNTRVTLSFDIHRSQVMTVRQKELISRRLSARINKRGYLRLSADTYRTQQGNKDEVTRRFVRLLQQALHEQRPRKKTRIPKRAKERRLSAKKNRGKLKQMRQRKINRHE